MAFTIEQKVLLLESYLRNGQEVNEVCKYRSAERYDVFEILLALGWSHCFPSLASQT